MTQTWALIKPCRQLKWSNHREYATESQMKYWTFLLERKPHWIKLHSGWVWTTECEMVKRKSYSVKPIYIKKKTAHVFRSIHDFSHSITQLYHIICHLCCGSLAHNFTILVQLQCILNLFSSGGWKHESEWTLLLLLLMPQSGLRDFFKG